MSAAHPHYPLDAGFVKLERDPGMASQIAHLPTLLTFSDDWGWFQHTRIPVEDDDALGADAAIATNPAHMALAVVVGLMGASMVTLLAALTLLVVVLVSV